MSSLAELEVADAAAYTFSQVRAGDLVVRLNNSNSPGFHAGYTTPTPATLISATSSNIELGTGSNMATLSNNAFIVGASGTGQVSANNLGLFRNRIINGDMLINQRGITTCNLIAGNTGTHYVTYDRWCTSNNITTGVIRTSNIPLTVSDTPFQYGFQTSLRFTASTAATNYLLIAPMQRIEGNSVRDFMWGFAFGQPATLSFWMRTSLASNARVPITIRNSNAVASNTWCYATEVLAAGSNVWSYYTVNIPAPGTTTLGLWGRSSNCAIEVIIGGRQTSNTNGTSNMWINSSNVGTSGSVDIWATVNNCIEFTGVQLEKGTIATPFEFRAQTTELQLCQRYFECSFGVYVYTFNAQNNIDSGSGTLYYSQGVTLQVYKRSSPAVNTWIDVRGNAAGSIYSNGNYAVTVWAVGNSTFSLRTASALGAGYGGYDANAEL